MEITYAFSWSKSAQDCVVISQRSPLRLLLPPCLHEFTLRYLHKLFSYSSLGGILC